MGPAGPNLGRFPSKFLLMIIPGLIASGIVALVLYAVHVSRAPESTELLTDLTPQDDGLSTEERRGLTRQMLKARRENPQEPAQVRPTPTLRPSTTGLAEDPAIDTNAHADRVPAVAPLPPTRPAIARVRPEQATPVTAAVPAATSGAVAPSPTVTAQPAAPQPSSVAPTLLPSVMVNTNPPPGLEPEPQPRSFAANVFSSISTMAGTAANATGNTVNWVIDLPGKAISAGGKLLGGDSTASNPPPAPPPPVAAPPPAVVPPLKRNL